MSASVASFVRGTSDPQVFQVMDGVRRSVPDAATLRLISGGQAVRTQADADLAAVTVGPPLPSRADGILLASRMTPLPPSRPVFYMARGERRLLPDMATLLGLLRRGSQVQDIDPVDLGAIPQGATLPTRAEGTVYAGFRPVYAYLIQAGQKRAVPNATTMRDAGFGGATLLTITAADLADIPGGAAVSSTSRFLNPPASVTPLVLLPVRLETRFQGSELWLRIYPDDVHVDSFEPDLTSEESNARRQYLSQAGTGGDAAHAAFIGLTQRFGPARAAWIASADARPGTKTASWTRAARTDVLPERWIVIGYQSNAQGQVLGTGTPIADTLALGPAPGGPGLAADESMSWIADFDRAVQAGMALRIPLTAVQQRGFNRIVVLGLRSGLDPAAAAVRLGALLTAHHYTDGIELLPHGAPTNNTEEVKSGFTSRDPNRADLFALEQGRPLCPSRPTADGDRLALALGISPSLLAHVRGADGGQDEQAHAMNEVSGPRAGATI